MDYIHIFTSFSNKGAKRLSERNALTSEYNPYKRGTRVIKCLLYTPRFSKKNGRNNKTFIQKSDGISNKTIQVFKWNERDDKTIHSQKILN